MRSKNEPLISPKASTIQQPKTSLRKSTSPPQTCAPPPSLPKALSPQRSSPPPFNRTSQPSLSSTNSFPTPPPYDPTVSNSGEVQDVLGTDSTHTNVPQPDQAGTPPPELVSPPSKSKFSISLVPVGPDSSDSEYEDSPPWSVYVCIIQKGKGTPLEYYLLSWVHFLATG